MKTTASGLRTRSRRRNRSAAQAHDMVTVNLPGHSDRWTGLTVRTSAPTGTFPVNGVIKLDRSASIDEAGASISCSFLEPRLWRAWQWAGHRSELDPDLTSIAGCETPQPCATGCSQGLRRFLLSRTRPPRVALTRAQGGGLAAVGFRGDGGSVTP